MLDKALNQIMSSARIVVEDTLSGVKRCRIVKDVFCSTKAGFTDLVLQGASHLHTCVGISDSPFPRSLFWPWLAKSDAVRRTGWNKAQWYLR
jgi:hypothetical protein